MLLDEIVSSALLGTRGAQVRLPTLPDELAATLPAPTGDAESQLLDAAAGVAFYLRAGGSSHQNVAVPKPCQPDRWNECSPRAADILAQAFEDRLHPLFIEWLELAAAVQCRPPSAMLPKLLEAAAAKKSLQTLVAAVIDERGRWLTQFNPRWQFTNQSEQPAEDIWQTGNTQQRADVLRAIRQNDPAKARELIAATWRDDGADDRTGWVLCLQINLSADDEGFLETCLDDRSSRVREAAANLLSRLPNSTFVARMIDRLRPLVLFTPGTAGQLLKLKRASKAAFEVRLPEGFEKSMQRDGMSEKPNETLGQKQWWLLQMIASVPLSFWTTDYNSSPATLIDAVPDEFAMVFIRGWLASLSRTTVADWIEPLIAAAKSEIRIDENVLHVVPVQQRSAVLQTLLKASDRKRFDFPKLLEAWRPLEKSVSEILLSELDLSMILLYDAFFYLHPSTLAALEAKLNQQEMPEHRRKIDQAMSVIALRRELHKELSP